MADLAGSTAQPIHYVEPRASGSARVNVGLTERVVSAVGGGLLTLYGLRKGGLSGLALAGIGGSLVYRGTSGHCPVYSQLGMSTSGGEADSAPEPVEVVEAVTVNLPRGEVYEFWRRLENLPRFMQHIRSVDDLGEGRSRWVAKGPGAVPDVEWDAETVEDVPAERLVWRSVAGADIDNAGHVEFKDAPHGGTEVHVRIGYRPPAGALGAAAARLLDPVLSQMVREDVRRFKHVIETGEVPTTEGQPKGK